MHNRQKQATLYDVAREAGVSYQSVSRVINAIRLVSRETRARVLQSIRKLDYQPLHAAQSLSSRRSHVI